MPCLTPQSETPKQSAKIVKIWKILLTPSWPHMGAIHTILYFFRRERVSIFNHPNRGIGGAVCFLANHLQKVPTDLFSPKCLIQHEVGASPTKSDGRGKKGRCRSIFLFYIDRLKRVCKVGQVVTIFLAEKT